MARLATLEVLITASDEASKKIADFEARTKNLAELATRAGKGFAILGGAITGALGFAVKAAIDAERQMAIFNATLDNSAGATDEVRGRLLDAANAATRFGFDNNAAANSLAGFFQRTGNVNAAMALFNTTMDLAARENIDLASATDKFNLLIAGSPKLLRRYKIELEEGATEVEKFTALQERLAGTAEKTSETLGGQLRAAQQQFNQLQQEIGAQLIPTLVSALEAIKPIIEGITNWAKENPQLFNTLVKVTGAVGLASLALGGLLLAVAPVLAAIKIYISVAALAHAGSLALVATWGGLAIAAGFAVVQVARLAFSFAEFADTVGGAKNATDLWLLSVEESVERFLGLEERANKTRELFDTLAVSYQENANKSGEAGSAVEKLKEEMASVATDVTADLVSGLSSINKQVQDVGTSSEDAAGKIKKLREDLLALVQKEVTREESERAQLAEKIVNQEQVVTDIRNQLAQQGAQVATAAELTRFNELSARLQKEEAALQLAHQLSVNLQDEISEVKRRALLTDFERFVEDQNKRNEIAKKEFMAAIQRIKDETEAVQGKLLKIEEIEAVSAVNVKKIQDDVAQNAINQAARAASEAGKEIDNLGSRWESLRGKLATPISFNVSGGGGGGGGFRNPNAGFFGSTRATLFAHGGIVTRPTLGIVGEAGAEAVVPLTGRGAGMLGGITLNISGNTIFGGSPTEVARIIGDNIIRQLNTQLRIG